MNKLTASSAYSSTSGLKRLEQGGGNLDEWGPVAKNRKKVEK